jgi:zinc transporter 2
MASILCLIFLIAEIAGGLISGSLAILSDAAHLFSDLMGFVFAIAAGKVASMPGSRNYVSLLLTMLFMFMAKFGLA